VVLILITIKMETTQTKTAKANQPSASVRKSKFTEYWEKHSNGSPGQILDYRAVLK
jgi:hypothetical protein